MKVIRDCSIVSPCDNCGVFPTMVINVGTYKLFYPKCFKTTIASFSEADMLGQWRKLNESL